MNSLVGDLVRSLAARPLWWAGAGVLGVVVVVTLALAAHRHHRVPAATSAPAAAGSTPAASPGSEADTPADLPDFEVDAVSVFEGEATWYRLTRNSLPLRRAWPGEFTAASDRIAPDTYVRVRRIDAKGDPDRAIVVRITDHGVHRKNTVLDLNRRAAGALGMVKDGQARVRVEVLALKHATTDKPVGKKTDPPLLPKASQITDQPVATGKQERENARAKVADRDAP